MEVPACRRRRQSPRQEARFQMRREVTLSLWRNIALGDPGTIVDSGHSGCSDSQVLPVGTVICIAPASHQEAP